MKPLTVSQLIAALTALDAPDARVFLSRDADGYQAVVAASLGEADDTAELGEAGVLLDYVGFEAGDGDEQ